MYVHTYTETYMCSQTNMLDIFMYSQHKYTNTCTYTYNHTHTHATHMFVCVRVCVSICVCLFVTLFLFLLLSSSLSPFACICIYIQNWVSGKAPRNIHACRHMLTCTPPHTYVSNTGLHTFLNDLCYRFAHKNVFHINT